MGGGEEGGPSCRLGSSDGPWVLAAESGHCPMSSMEPSEGFQQSGIIRFVSYKGNCLPFEEKTEAGKATRQLLQWSRGWTVKALTKAMAVRMQRREQMRKIWGAESIVTGNS